MNSVQIFDPKATPVKTLDEDLHLFDVIGFRLFCSLTGCNVHQYGDAEYGTIFYQGVNLVVFPTAKVMHNSKKEIHSLLTAASAEIPVYFGYVKGYPFIAMNRTFASTITTVPFQLEGYIEEKGARSLPVVVSFNEVFSALLNNLKI
jgi:hypothetical protein